MDPYGMWIPPPNEWAQVPRSASYPYPIGGNLMMRNGVAPYFGCMWPTNPQYPPLYGYFYPVAFPPPIVPYLPPATPSAAPHGANQSSEATVGNQAFHEVQDEPIYVTEEDTTQEEITPPTPMQPETEPINSDDSVVEMITTTQEKDTMHPGETSEWRCTLCNNKVFKKKQYFLIHKKMFHVGKRQYRCYRCKKGFTDAEALSQHHREHRSLVRRRCEKCPKQFKTLTGLQRHQKYHSVRFPYVCSICAKGYVYHGNMLAHQRQCSSNCYKSTNTSVVTATNLDKQLELSD